MITKNIQNVDRYSKYGQVVGCLTALTLGVFWLTHYITADRLYALTDFSAFYIAGQMALEGQTAVSYDLQSYQAFYKQYFAREESGYGWFYPPHFLLLLSPLAELPRVFAKFIWLAGTYAVYIFGMSKLVRRPAEWVFVIFLPAAFINLHAAQTGFLSTGLLALYLSFAESGNEKENITARIAAGIALSLLTFKPHLWVTLPLLVLLQRQYIVLVTCIFAIVLLVTASMISFGYEPWLAMLSSVLSGYENIHDGQTLLHNKMSTISTLASHFGLSDIKLIFQLLFLALSAYAICWMASRQSNKDVIVAFTIVSALLVAPHNMLYDQTILIIPFLLVMRPENASPKSAIVLLAIVYFSPYITFVSDMLNYFPIGAALVLVFWIGLLVQGVQSSRQVQQNSSNFAWVHPKVFQSPSGRVHRLE